MLVDMVRAVNAQLRRTQAVAERMDAEAEPFVAAALVQAVYLQSELAVNFYLVECRTAIGGARDVGPIGNSEQAALAAPHGNPRLQELARAHSEGEWLWHLLAGAAAARTPAPARGLNNPLFDPDDTQLIGSSRFENQLDPKQWRAAFAEFHALIQRQRDIHAEF